MMLSGMKRSVYDMIKGASGAYLTPFNVVVGFNYFIICTFAPVLRNISHERYCVGWWKRYAPLPNH